MDSGDSQSILQAEALPTGSGAWNNKKGKAQMRDEISSAIFDMLDIKNSLSKRIKSKLKDEEGTETTIGDCIDSVIETLERLEASH